MGDDEAKKAAAAAAANAATSRRIKTFAHEQPKGYSTNVRPRYGTSFGTMISSEKQTAPSAGMGSSNREHKSRVHISEEHSLNSMRGTYSPGPIYKPRTRTDEILVRRLPRRRHFRCLSLIVQVFLLVVRVKVSYLSCRNAYGTHV